MRIRAVAKEIIYNSLHFAGLTWIARQRQKNGLIVLTYHSFTEDTSMTMLDSEPISRFEKQVRFLKQNYRLVSLEKGIQRLKDGDSDPKPMAAITIDDGFEDNYTLMFQVSKKYQIPTTIFIATDFIDTGRPPWPTQIMEALLHTESRFIEYPVKLPLEGIREKIDALISIKNVWKHLPGEERFSLLEELRRHLKVGSTHLSKPLRWTQIIEMSENNVVFGSHTEYHSILPAIDESAAIRELSVSKSRIEKELGKPCTLFSYPNGDWDERTRKLIEKAGYSAAVTQQYGMNSADSHLHSLKRIEVPYDESLGTFACRSSLLVKSFSQNYL